MRRGRPRRCAGRSPNASATCSTPSPRGRREPDPAARRAAAIRLFTGLVGAMVVARAVDDPGLSDEILAAAREAVAEGR